MVSFTLSDPDVTLHYENSKEDFFFAFKLPNRIGVFEKKKKNSSFATTTAVFRF